MLKNFVFFSLPLITLRNPETCATQNHWSREHMQMWFSSELSTPPDTIQTQICNFVLHLHGYGDRGFIIAEIQTIITALVVMHNSWYRGTASLFIWSASSNSPLYIVKHTHCVDSSMLENMSQTYVLCKRNKSSKLVSYPPVSRQCRQFMLREIISQGVKLLHKNK